MEDCVECGLWMVMSRPKVGLILMLAIMQSNARPTHLSFNRPVPQLVRITGAISEVKL